MNDTPNPCTHPRLDEWTHHLYIRWCGPDDVARRLHLQPAHPGFLVYGDEEHTLINWADVHPDTGGIRQHHGHLQANWLEVVSEREHHHAVEQLRASGWLGFPIDDQDFLAAWRAEPHPYHRLDRLPICSYVRWRGPDVIAGRLHLQPGHTGLLIAADEAHAVIDWTDVPEVLQYNGRLDHDWLELITEQEHQHANERLRSSGWAGFPWQDEQAMAAWSEDLWITGGEAFPPGTPVRFVGDDHVAELLALQPGHPGRVTSSGEKHACVDWVDVQGVFQHDGVMGPEWLVAIDEDDYQRRADAVRRFDWPGFEAAGQDGLNHLEHDAEQT
ncbi:hypothetical protein [Kineococcus sp. SYSU DK001]|uniref:hypothetical protein n=1 Tax=Kineococcus sp. SYSU DK001 TaxID=3383122 RepID=UPI003D7EFB7D